MPVSGNATERPKRAPRVKTTLPKEASKANDAIFLFVRNKYFRSIPLDQIYQVVESAGFTFDPEEQPFMLVGRDGKMSVDLHDKEGRPVNHMLVMTWHKMEPTGNYEIVAYVS